MIFAVLLSLPPLPKGIQRELRGGGGGGGGLDGVLPLVQAEHRVMGI